MKAKHLLSEQSNSEPDCQHDTVHHQSRNSDHRAPRQQIVRRVDDASSLVDGRLIVARKVGHRPVVVAEEAEEEVARHLGVGTRHKERR